MNVTNAKIEPTIEHGGTCRTYFMVPKEAMRAETEGSYLEYVSEFEIAAGSHLEPHRHNTHEFYYVLKGRALMQIGAEKREVEPGDLIHIPANASAHDRGRSATGPVRALAFAASFLPPGGAGTEAEMADLPGVTRAVRAPELGDAQGPDPPMMTAPAHERRTAASSSGPASSGWRSRAPCALAGREVLVVETGRPHRHRHQRPQFRGHPRRALLPARQPQGAALRRGHASACTPIAATTAWPIADSASCRRRRACPDGPARSDPRQRRAVRRRRPRDDFERQEAQALEPALACAAGTPVAVDRHRRRGRR